MYQVCSCQSPPAAISFPLRGKRYGRKGRLGYVWCFLPLNSGESQCFSLAFHTVVTLCMSWYAPPDTGVSDLILVAVEQLPSIEGAVEIRMDVTFLRGSITSPPHFVRHLPLTRGGLWGANSKAPLVKGSWRGAPEGLARRSGLASPMRGSCRRRRLMRWAAPRRGNCLHLIRHGLRRATFPS